MLRLQHLFGLMMKRLQSSEKESPDDIFLRVYLDGDMAVKVQLTEEYQETATEQYQIYDICSIQGITDAFSEMVDLKVKIVEGINKGLSGCVSLSSAICML